MNTQQLFRLRYRLKLTAMLVVVGTVALSSAGVRGAVRDAQVGSWLPKLAKLALLPVSGFMQGPIAGQGKPGAPEQPAGADGMVSLLVKTAPGLSERAQDAALARGGATRGGRIRALRMHVVRVPQVAVDAVAKRLQSDPDIELVEIDHKRQIAAQEVPQASGPSDPGHATQWSLERIRWNSAWSSVTLSGFARIAVLDTGVSAAAGDVPLEAGWSAFSTDPSVDANGHGTWVASIAAARANNGQGIAGVAFDRTAVLPVQVLDANGLGQDSDIINGVLWAVGMEDPANPGPVRADVILMAFSNPGFSQALQDAIDIAWSKGAVIVAATGNGGSAEATFPAGSAKVVGVSGTDQNDAMWTNSNHGPSVFMAAPAVDITALSPAGGIVSFSGTSASAAMVAGAAALLKAQAADDPLVTNGVIVGRLARTAEPAATQEQTGNGRLSVARALLDVTTDGVTPAGAAGGPYLGPDPAPYVDPYVAAANNDAHVAPGWAPTNTTTTFSTLYRKTTGGTVQHARITLPAGYTNISVAAMAFSSGTWSTPVVNQANRTVDVQLVSGAGLATNNVDWARIDVTATTPPGNQSGNAADWMIRTFTDVAGTSGEQNDNPPVLIGASTNPSATITFVDAGGAAILAPILEDGVAADLRVRITSASTGTTIKYTDIAVPTCFASPTAVTTTSSAGGTGGYSPVVTDGFIRMPSGQIPASGSLTVQFTVIPDCVSGTYLVASAPSTNASNPPSGTNQAVSTTGGSLTVIAGRADLSITKTDSPDPVASEGTITYTIGVTNGGPDPASAVKIVDTLPAGVTFLSASGTDWNCANASGTVTCQRTAGNLDPGVAPSITLQVTAPVGPTTLTNSATVSSPNDNTPGNNTAIATTTVKGPNEAPTATAQSVSTNEDTAKTITLSGTDQDDNSLTFAIGTSPTKGTLGPIGAVTCTGTAPKTCTADVVYTPNSNFSGSDSFTFTANDGTETSPPATVSIVVHPINDKPTAAANPASLTIDEDAAATSIELTGTDLETPANELKFVITHIPANGVLKKGVVTLAAGNIFLGSPSSVTYQPNANFNGADSFKFKVTDSGDPSGCSAAPPACSDDVSSDEVTVPITVNPVSDAPVAVNDSYTATEDTALTVPTPGVLANDTDVDAGDASSAILVTGPAHGTLALSADGSFTYTPAANYCGADSFSYKANDGDADSNVATVSLAVTCVNDAPVAANDSYTATEDTLLTIVAPGVLTNDTDVDAGDLSTAVVVTGPAHGTLALSADGAFTYTPAANYCGADSFSYKANDGEADSNVATVSLAVTCVNDAPVAANDSYTATEDTALTIAAPGVLSNDTDVDTGDASSAVLVTGPAHGTLALSADGSFTYTPAANYCGADSFSYKANDGDADSNVATVTLTVTCVNDAPVAANDSYTATEDTALTIAAPGVLSNDTDVDTGDASSAVLVTGPAHGTLALSGDGAFTYTPAANYCGADSFSYKANDGDADSNVATVTLTVTCVNDSPVANGDTATLAEDSPATAIDVLANDTDPDNLSGPANAGLTVTAVTQGAHGTVAFTATGVTYTPAANYFGSDSFTYTISDGNGGTATATVNVTVTNVNDNPVANDDTATVAEDSGATAINVLANDNDGVDAGETLTVIGVTQGINGTVTFTATGVSYTPNANYFGPDSFTYTLSDGNGGTATATVRVTVTSVNDAPASVTANISAASIDENGSTSVSGTFTDPDTADTHTVTIDWGNGAAATVATLAPGTRSYSVSYQYLDDNPTATPVDVNSIKVTVADNGGLQGTASTSITVTNLAPVMTALTGPAAPQPAGSSALVGGTFTDVGTKDTHTCSVTWDDGTAASNGAVVETNGSGTCTANHVYSAPGVYTITMTIKDDDTGSVSATLSSLVVIYDPNAGFVTGGGWIDSPAGAYRVDGAALAMTGHANFGFVSQYKKGANVPTGQTEFQFQAGGLNFHSSVYEWLVVAGCKAQFKGTGTLNGVSGYKFLLTGTDGNKCSTTDKFRIKITNSSGDVVYDNNVSAPDDIDLANPQTIASGSIVIHEQGKK